MPKARTKRHASTAPVKPATLSAALEDPAVTLTSVLSTVACMASSIAHNHQQIEEVRRDSRERHLETLQQLCKFVSDPSAPAEARVQARDFLFRQAGKPIACPLNLGPWQESCDFTLALIREQVKRARKALECHGGKPADDALSPGTRRWSIEVQKRLKDVLAIAANLQATMAIEGVLLQDHIDKLRIVAKALADAGAELDAARTMMLDDSHFKPARWFQGKAAPRLRQATRPDRKTKQIRTRYISGVKCYLVDDVRQHWPELIPSEA